MCRRERSRLSESVSIVSTIWRTLPRGMMGSTRTIEDCNESDHESRVRISQSSDTAVGGHSTYVSGFSLVSQNCTH